MEGTCGQTYGDASLLPCGTCDKESGWSWRPPWRALQQVQSFTASQLQVLCLLVAESSGVLTLLSQRIAYLLGFNWRNLRELQLKRSILV